MRNDETLQLIVFSLEGRRLAVRTSDIIEVLEPVAVSPLPLVPDYIEGLINANGQIIPLIDLFKFSFDQSGDRSDESTFIVLRIKGSLIALRVGLIQEPLEVRSENLLENVDAAINSEHFPNLFKSADDEIYLFESGCLDGVVHSSDPEGGQQGFLGEPVGSHGEEEEVQNEYLMLDIASHVFACRLDAINEVIDVETVNVLPGSPQIVAGITLIRGVPTLILDVCSLLGIDAEEQENSNDMKTAVLFRSESAYFGVLIDHVIGLELFAETCLTTDSKGNAALLNADNVPVPVLTVEQLLSEGLLSQLKPFMPSVSSNIEEIRIKTCEVLRFYIEGDAYGIYLNDVRRILAGKPVEPLLDQHHCLMGTIDVEGRVIPVIDLPLQLEYGSRKAGEYIVVNDGSSDWALAVPVTDQILELPETGIDTLDEHGYLKAFSHVDESLISILDVASVCRPNAARQQEKV